MTTTEKFLWTNLRHGGQTDQNKKTGIQILDEQVESEVESQGERDGQ